MKEEDARFDVIYGGSDSPAGPYVAYHFCREWEGDEGCYGTNPNHGFTFEDAKQEIADYWASLSFDVWESLYRPEPDNEIAYEEESEGTE